MILPPLVFPALYDTINWVKHPHCSRMAPLQHGFKDPKWASPKAGFEKAKKLLDSQEWEDVVDGVVIIVALAKKSPEVRLQPMFVGR